MFATTLLVILGILASAKADHVNVFGNCVSSTDGVFTLKDTPLKKLNPWLKSEADYKSLVTEGCSEDRDAGTVCHDKPAIGSGFTQIFPNYFLGLTDRGPNQDCEDLYDLDPVKYADAAGKTGKGFPVMKFAPTIIHMRPLESGKLRHGDKVPLRGTDGMPITGLPNTAADDTPYAKDCVGNPLLYDPSGLDTEDLARFPGTDYVAIVDEYSPSVVIANYKTGIIKARHVPKSLEGPLSAAKYPIVADIPNVYTNRRKNRGFEAVVVNKKYVIAIVQSPMLGEDEDATINNNIIRCAYFKVTINDGVPSLKYKYSFVIEASSPAAYVNTANAPKDMKYSAAQHYKMGKFFVLERAKSQVKIFLVDFTKVTKLEKTKYAHSLDLEKETNGMYLTKQKGVKSAEKTLIWDSVPGVGGTTDFSGSSKQEGFAIDMKDDSKLWILADNDFGLENNENAQLFKVSLGRAPGGATVCEMPAHPPTPTIDVNPSKALRLVNSSTYRILDQPFEGAAENFDVSEKLMRAYVANDDAGSLDMYDISGELKGRIGRYEAGEPYIPTSASVCKKNGLVAVGLANDDVDEAPGRIDVLTKDLKLIRRIKKKGCVLVDHVKWSDDCTFLVGACEGEGADVAGGVLVADFGGPSGKRFRGAKVASFAPFDSLTNLFAPNGVRLIESKKPSVDLEPEYVTISGKNAFVVLQEANTIAVVDLYEAKVTELKPIGFIDRNKPGFAIDASDKDEMINIRNYPMLYGMPQPDTIQTYVAGDGMPYLVFANEGDAKDDAEEARGEDITDEDELNRTAGADLMNFVDDEALLGRLKFSSIMGYNAETNTQEKMYHFGSRSFSIMSLNGTVVFDSGEWFERILEKHFPKIFNAQTVDGDDFEKSVEDLFENR